MSSKASQKVRTREELKSVVQRLQSYGKAVVFTNGCFDILHVGHIRYLEHAKSLGNYLVIGINSDDSVRKLKGPARPLNSEMDRAEVVAALQAVDYVTLFTEDTPEEIIAELRPDIHVKGGDYRIEDLPEADVVHGYGGKVVILPFVDGKSTTSIVERIKDTSVK